jgi:retron-type reverse transcriptase
MSTEKLHLDFGLFNVDLNRVIRLLKDDLKDDWFLDPLLYDDRLNPDIISEYFLENIERNNGVYVPSHRIVFNIPKKGNTLRHTLETHLFDRIAYHSFGKVLLMHFDFLIDRRVFNHRLNFRCFDDSKHNQNLFLNSIEQWKKFEGFVRVDATGKCILETDLQNYYENISLKNLRQTMYLCLNEVKVSGREKARIRFCIESIITCLESWTLNGENGLPQNRDVSSFLANIYMLPVDRLMIERGYDYYRYMDDIKILCQDKYKARQALQDLINVLRERGLSVNSAKTKIIEPDTDEHKKFVQSDTFTLERIDAMLNTRKKALVAIAFKQIKDNLIRPEQNDCLT